ncbi:rhodanese-like domain-containing protein [Suttonella sp. R2A3]|uniref:rhodanese-like domain-containing protein n=1 Tax=Suttonella sp. R2A3 TaxID=2908648 RepID=UPI001F3CB55D|nr:rhodanese-like domain-containing protein [Suttonella sp. R2A3]UJF24265.1 rhodanese-like domain-containing protein [Suttonella sp. R2A3]
MKQWILLGLIFCSGLLHAAEKIWVIDVRSVQEYRAEHIGEAALMPYDNIAQIITSSEIAKDDTVYLYCRSGRRAEIARQTLQDMGYTNVVNLGSMQDAKAFLLETLPE